MRQKNLESLSANDAAAMRTGANKSTGKYAYTGIAWKASRQDVSISAPLPQHSHTSCAANPVSSHSKDLQINAATTTSEATDHQSDEKSRKNSVLLKQNDFTLNSAFLHAVASFLIRLALGTAETEEYSSSGGGGGSSSKQAIKLFHDICVLHPNITQGKCG